MRGRRTRLPFALLLAALLLAGCATSEPSSDRDEGDAPTPTTTTPTSTPSTTPPAATPDGTRTVVPARPANNWTFYVPDDGAYQLSYPPTWDETEYPGADFVVIAPGEADAPFRANFNVFRFQLAEEPTLERVLNDSIVSLEQYITDFRLLDSRIDEENHRVELSYEGRQGKHDLAWRQAVLVNGAELFGGTVTTLRNDSTGLSLGLGILDTFRLRPADDA